MRVIPTHAAEMASPAAAGTGRNWLTARRSTPARSANHDKLKTVRASARVLERSIDTALPKRYGALLCMTAEAERRGNRRATAWHSGREAEDVHTAPRGQGAMP
jgi:hypothetical protein